MTILANLFNFPIQDKLYLYNRYEQRITSNLLPTNFKPLPFYFFGSSSSGNSVYLKRLHVLIDLGFAYNHYRAIDPDFFLDVEHIILTHEHSDHFNPTTLFKILKQYPNVKFWITHRMFDTITNPELFDKKNHSNGLTNRQQTELKTIYQNRFQLIEQENQTIINQNRNDIEYWFIPHFTQHGLGPKGLINLGIEIISKQLNLHLLYASDLDHLFDYHGIDQVGGLPTGPRTLVSTDQMNDHYQYGPIANPFNLIFLEANYDETIVNKVLQENPYDPHARGNKRHISEQEAWKYVKLNLSNDGIFVPLHASHTYGTLVQDLSTKED